MVRKSRKIAKLQNSAHRYVFQKYTISREIERFKDFIYKIINHEI